MSAEKITFLCRVVFPGTINNNSTQFFILQPCKKAMMEACTTARLHRLILALLYSCTSIHALQLIAYNGTMYDI